MIHIMKMDVIVLGHLTSSGLCVKFPKRWQSVKWEVIRDAQCLPSPRLGHASGSCPPAADAIQGVPSWLPKDRNNKHPHENVCDCAVVAGCLCA